MDNATIAGIFRTAARNGFIQIDEATATEMADHLEGSIASEPAAKKEKQTKAK